MFLGLCVGMRPCVLVVACGIGGQIPPRPLSQMGIMCAAFFVPSCTEEGAPDPAGKGCSIVFLPLSAPTQVFPVVTCSRAQHVLGLKGGIQRVGGIQSVGEIPIQHPFYILVPVNIAKMLINPFLSNAVFSLSKHNY